MKIIILLLGIVLLTSCLTKKIDSPSVVDVKEIPDPVIHESKYIREDVISGKIIHQDTSSTHLVAIKLVVNDSICVNTYGNFDREFSINYDSSMIKTDSYLEIVYHGYSRKKISFSKLSRNNKIFLEKTGKLISFKEYRDFYEDIRS